MPTKRQVVFLASVDWGSAWQRHQAWAARFAAAGWDVFFVENTGLRGVRMSDAKRVLGRLRRASNALRVPELHPGVRVIAPIVLPPTAQVFRQLNRKWLVPRLVAKIRAAGLRPGALIFAYLPTSTTLDLLDLLEPGCVVYDCVDNFAGNPDHPRDLRETEEALLKRAACVLATSPYLFERLSALHPNVHELHHGVDERFFAAAAAAPREYRRFCYFGSLWHAIDYAYVRALAAAGFEVDLLGPATEPPPALPALVRRLPPVPAAELPAALAPYDGLLLPYADTPYNRGVLPAKTYECLATGKPVLASPIGGLTRFDRVFYVRADPGEWARVARGLSETESGEGRRERVELARRHTTAGQFEKLLSLLKQVYCAG